MPQNRMGRRALKSVLAALLAGGILAGCGPIAAPKPNANAPSHMSKTNAGTPRKSGLYHAGKRTAQKTGQTANNAVGSARHGAKTAGKSVTQVGRRAGVVGSPRRRGSWLTRTSRVKAESLATLPSLTYLKQLNPWLKRAHQISTFIPGMGYHWATPYPSIVLMTNQSGLVTGVETTFPQKLGTYPWFDPPTTVPNAGVADNSEHLYFVAPGAIAPTMTTTASDLMSWSAFAAVNPRVAAYVKEPATFFGLTVYGPPRGPGLKVLTSSSGAVEGFLVEEPALWGRFPGYYPPRHHKPMLSREFGKAYVSVLLLAPLPKGVKP